MTPLHEVDRGLASTTVNQLEMTAAFRRVGLLGLASLVAGILVLGIGGRVVMAFSAAAAPEGMIGRLTENGNTIGEFTIDGTLALIVFVGILGGLFGSVAIVASDPWLDWLGPFKGAGASLVFLAFFAQDGFDSVDFRILEPIALNVVMFLSLGLIYGYSVYGINTVLDRRLPPASGPQGAQYSRLVRLGVFPLAMSVAFFTVPSFCGCAPAYGLGLALLVMAASTAIRTLAPVSRLIPSWATRIAPITGYGALAIGLSAGLTGAANDILRLLS